MCRWRWRAEGEVGHVPLDFELCLCFVGLTEHKLLFCGTIKTLGHCIGGTYNFTSLSMSMLPLESELQILFLVIYGHVWNRGVSQIVRSTLWDRPLVCDALRLSVHCGRLCGASMGSNIECDIGVTRTLFRDVGQIYRLVTQSCHLDCGTPAPLRSMSIQFR